MAHPIYISHAPEDAALAQELAKYIESRSLVPNVGSASDRPLTQAAMILLFTESTNASPSVVKDFEVATQRRIPIVGLRIAASFLGEAIENLNPNVEWVTAIVGKPNDHFPKLIDQVAIHLQGVHVAAHFDAPMAAVPDTMSTSPPVQSYVESEPPPYEVEPAPQDVDLLNLEDDPYGLILLDAGPNKISVIATLREMTGLDLGEAKAMSESAPVCILVCATEDIAQQAARAFQEVGATVGIEKDWTSTTPLHLTQPLRNPATMSAPPIAYSQPDAPAVAYVQYDVVLTSPGANPLGLIKAIRDITGLGLAECKDIADGAMPQSLARVDSYEQAVHLRDSLYAVGAAADAIEASPATAPHFVRRPVPAASKSGCGVAVGCLVGFFFLFILIGIFTQ